jgi:hypothetical protein
MIKRGGQNGWLTLLARSRGWEAMRYVRVGCVYYFTTDFKAWGMGMGDEREGGE